MIGLGSELAELGYVVGAGLRVFFYLSFSVSCFVFTVECRVSQGWMWFK